MSRILCILPTIGDTKDAKRIELLQAAGFELNAAAFDRGTFISRLPKCPMTVIGRIQNGKYLKRIFLFKSISILRNLIRDNDIIYAMGPDLAFLGYIASLGLNKTLIMDVADIQKLQIKKTVGGKIVRLFDKIAANKSDLIAVTSNAFISNYYNLITKEPITNYLVLENKVDYNIPVPQRLYDNKKIRIGYFGVLRDNWTIDYLLELLKRRPDKFEIKLAGIDQIEKFNIHDLESKFTGFIYLGPYKSPTDLLNIYNEIDVIVIFYPDFSSDKEWFEAKRICRSNRYYEACYFKKPIISFAFNEDGKNVEKNNIGFTLNNYSIEESVNQSIQQLNELNINNWITNIIKLPTEHYKIEHEVTLIKSRINELLQNKRDNVRK